ncbi:MAG: FecR domain-containing protein [Candidatus Omnitrophota bacterium]
MRRIIFAAFCLFLVFRQADAGALVEIYKVKGKAYYLGVKTKIGDKKWQTIFSGTVLRGNERIKTMADSQCIMLVNPNTVICVLAESDLQILDYGRRVMLEDGGMYASVVAAQDRKSFAVKTAEIVCEMSGGAFGIFLSGGETVAEVYKGSLRVKGLLLSDEQDVAEGLFCIADEFGNMSDPEKIKSEDLENYSKWQDFAELYVSELERAENRKMRAEEERRSAPRRQNGIPE